MESSSRWLRDRFEVDPSVEDRMIEMAALVPDGDVYTPMESVTGIVIHHSATDSGSADVFRALHRIVNGWDDLGYHYVIGNGSRTGDGMVEEGRPLWAAGAHSRLHNDRTIGICLVGDFTRTSPTKSQLDSLGQLLSQLLARFDLGKDAIFLHRSMAGNLTECPGPNLTLEMVLKTIT